MLPSSQISNNFVSHLRVEFSSLQELNFLLCIWNDCLLSFGLLAADLPESPWFHLSV